MKHLKLFEGYLDNYYEEISSDEWQEITEQSNEKFSDKDKSKLEILLKECDSIIDVDWDYNGVIRLNTIKAGLTKKIWWIQKNSNAPKKSKHKIKFDLYIEALVDDYYLVWIDYGISDWYFKCDQFEGLAKLLKDRGIL